MTVVQKFEFALVASLQYSPSEVFEVLVHTSFVSFSHTMQ